MATNKYELQSSNIEKSSNDNDVVKVTEDDEKENVVTEDTVQLKRELGLTGGISFIVGCIIGSGIFVSPKGVLDGTGSVGSSILVWAGAGIISLLGSLCYCELGTMIPKSGGEYTYIRQAFGNLPAFLYIWVSVILIRPSSMAIMSLTFGMYFSSVFELCGAPQLPHKLAAIACLLTIMLLNCYSTKLSARLQIITTLAKVAALFVVIIGGIYMITKGNTSEIATGFSGSITEPSTIALAFYDALWAYDGWNNLNYVTEELKNPKKNLPRANIISIISVIIIYILTNFAYLTAMTKTELLEADAVAMLWGERVILSAAIIMPLAVMISTLGSTNANAFSGGRSLFAASRDGNFPELFSFVNVKQFTPVPSMVFTIIISVAFVLIGDVSSLIDFFSFSAWLFYGLTFSSLIYFRYKLRDVERPYKVPLPIPILMVLISIYLVIAPIISDPAIEFLYATIFILGGTIFYFPFVYYKLKIPYFDDVTTWVQLIFEVVPVSKFVD
uniref:b(0,+)-type amino acid transporter 1 n=1 Tax=Arion vulgaris TaxID=1028688 RepID=A0A0B7AWD6_9EUPU